MRESWGYFDPDGSGEDCEEKNDEGGDGPCRVYAAEMMQEGNALRNYWRRRIAYAADWQDSRYGHGLDGPKRWRPSIHMPRWASRILLEVTEVRVERLQDISEADAKAEGVYAWAHWLMDNDKVTEADISALQSRYGTGLRAAYAALWDSINGAGSWDANPWVWAVSFKRIKP